VPVSAPWAAIWLNQGDLENATSIATVAACFDDGNGGGALNTGAIASVIARAELKVLSWLGDEYGPPPFSPVQIAVLQVDPFLAYAALEYCIAFMFDRHPEYVRANGKERGERFKRAEDQMQQVLDGRQRLPVAQAVPANVGGVSTDGAARIISDNPDGSTNSGDY
jgi:hypothetical protein